MKRETQECAECDKVFLEPYHNTLGDAYWIGDKHFCSPECSLQYTILNWQNLHDS